MNFKSTAVAWFFELGSACVGRLPSRWHYPVVRGLGQLYGSFPHAQKRAMETNLRALFNLDDRTLHDTTNTLFQNFALTLYDFFFPEGIVIDVAGKEKLEALRKRHGGIMLLTFHMGHWELGARAMRSWGWPVTAVYQPYEDKKLKEVIEKRRAAGVNFIPVGANAAAGVRRALKNGDVVAMLGDHPFGEEGTPVKLLGRTVIWPKGPVVLAVKEKVPIVIGVIVRKAPRHYQALIQEALLPHSKSRAEIDRLVQEVATKFGKLLTEHTTQWYRFREFEFVDGV